MRAGGTQVSKMALTTRRRQPSSAVADGLTYSSLGLSIGCLSVLTWQQLLQHESSKTDSKAEAMMSSYDLASSIYAVGHTDQL